MATRVTTPYSKYLEAVKGLDYIEDTESADAAAKAVLGTLASRLDEREARRLTEHLPGPLTYEKLHGHQANITEIPVSVYLSDIAVQFALTDSEAKELIGTVLRVAEGDVGRRTMGEIRAGLPDDWRRFLDQL